MGLFSFLKKPDPIDDADLGRLSYQANEWCGNIELPTGLVELAIAGDKKGLDPFARSYWIRKESDIPQLWNDAVAFSKEKLEEWGWADEIEIDKFDLLAVAVHREKSFDGGHLSFWFEYRPDENGSYYVSFRDEKPFNFHRDS